MATILCIDDQTYALTERVEWLRTHGYVVIVADSIQAAVDAFLVNPIDAAVLDCHLAGACAELLEHLRPGFPVLVLTSYCSAPCPLEGVATACVGKGEPPDVLLHTLQTILEGEDEAAA